MQTSVTFKNLDPSKHFRFYVQDKLNRFDKLLDNPSEANVVLSVEKLRHIAEVNLAGGRLNINAKEENSDMHAAIDLVLDKLKTQITKSKQKRRGKKNESKNSLKNQEIADSTTVHLTDEAIQHVMVKNIEYKPMDVEEAIMQLDLVTDQFLVFTNAQTNKVNVIYHRKNGDYGLIQPSN